MLQFSEWKNQHPDVSLVRVSEQKLREQIGQLEALRDQAKAAVENVLQLLKKADKRRLLEGERPWNRILDNLERTLDLTRSRLTKYEQQIKECTRQRRRIQEGLPAPTSGAVPGDEEQATPGVLAALLPQGVRLPRDHVRAAERILAMPLDVLANLTLNEVAEMNDQLFEQDEEQPARVPSDAREAPSKKSRLAQRIKRAKQTREALAATRRPPEPSFAERRRRKTLRESVAKVMSGNSKALDLEEVEILLQCHESLTERASVTVNDLRLKGILDGALESIQERGSELRRKRARMYARKQT